MSETRRPRHRTMLLAFLIGLYATTSLAADGKKEVYFFNWSEYLPETVIKKFEAETGIKVIYSTYESNEVLYTKLKLMKDGGYDLIIPSTYYLDRFVKEGLIEKLDKSKLSNIKNLDPALMKKSFDPNNDYSLPYLWGATVPAVNAKKINPAQINSWADFWRPEFKNQLLLLNDYREVFFIALKVLGYSGNTRDPKQIAAAYEKLKTLKPNVRVFESQSPKTSFLAGDVNIGAIWNGELFMAQNENPNIKGILPKEGFFFFMDNLAIPKNAKHRDEAHQLINFLLRPEISKEIADDVGYSSPNRETLKLLPAEVRNDTFRYPTAAMVKAGEFQEDIGDAAMLYEKYWEDLKALK